MKRSGSPGVLFVEWKSLKNFETPNALEVDDQLRKTERGSFFSVRLQQFADNEIRRTDEQRAYIRFVRHSQTC